MLDARKCRALLALSVLLVGGCAGGRWPLSSKWAMADGDYANKYSKPYPEGQRYRRMAKQMVDARHVAGKSGAYIGGAGQSNPSAGGLEVGVFHYAADAPWLEGRASLSGLFASSAEDLFAGVNLGARAQVPSRVAPFVGVGTYVGMTPYGHRVSADDDDIDNDDDWSVDEDGEVRYDHDFFAAVYPEVGVHLWATPRMRFTGSASYMITTEGRDHDFWYFGVNVAWLDIRPRSEPKDNPYLVLEPATGDAASDEPEDLIEPESPARLPVP
jgi:hypothetical protein